jgi:hypothetical protein
MRNHKTLTFRNKIFKLMADKTAFDILSNKRFYLPLYTILTRPEIYPGKTMLTRATPQNTIKIVRK